MEDKENKEFNYPDINVILKTSRKWSTFWNTQKTTHNDLNMHESIIQPNKN